MTFYLLQSVFSTYFRAMVLSRRRVETFDSPPPFLYHSPLFLLELLSLGLLWAWVCAWTILRALSNLKTCFHQLCPGSNTLSCPVSNTLNFYLGFITFQNLIVRKSLPLYSTMFQHQSFLILIFRGKKYGKLNGK